MMICSGGQNDVIDGLLSPELWSISLQCSSILPPHNIHDTGTHRCAFIIDVFYYSAFLRAVSYAAQCAHAQCLIPRSVLYRAVSYTAQCLLPRLVLCRAMSNVPQCLMPHIFRRGCRTAGRPWRARTADGLRTVAAAAEAAQKVAQPPKKGPPFSTFS